MIFIIAEAGICHNGSVSIAQDMIDAAVDAGADAVKFQMFNSQRLWGDDRIRQYELDASELARLSEHCDTVGIEFMCTPFGVTEVEFLSPLVRRMKVSSGCIGRTDLLDAVRATGLPVVLSTGMSTPDDVHGALEHLGSDVTLLHCTSSYPCALADVNLNAMETLKDFGYPVGYSDHTDGIVVALAAAARGAVVIEKHLTMDRNAEGPDHKASIEPSKFKRMVDGIRQIELALGDGVKRVLPAEEELRKIWRAS